MTKVVVPNVGPAERQIVRLLISDITDGDRNNALLARTIRRQFKLRELGTLHTQLVESEQNKQIADLGEEPDPNQVALIRRSIVGVSWSVLLDEGLHLDDGEEKYGDPYDLDKTTLTWLKNRRDEHKMWIWSTDKDGKRTALEISPEMLDAIASLDIAIGLALE